MEYSQSTKSTPKPLGIAMHSGEGMYFHEKPTHTPIHTLTDVCLRSRIERGDCVSLLAPKPACVLIPMLTKHTVPHATPFSGQMLVPYISQHPASLRVQCHRRQPQSQHCLFVRLTATALAKCHASVVDAGADARVATYSPLPQPEREREGSTPGS
jgi:hypothetical protein